MASAPRPGGAGTSKAVEQVEAAKTVMKIRIGDHAPVTIAPGLIPLGEKLIVRKALGLPFEAFAGDDDHIGEDSIAVMWWLARRANGEPMLTWTQVEADWPSGLTPDDIDVDVSDGEGEDPEA